MHVSKHDEWGVLNDSSGASLGVADAGAPTPWLPAVTLVQPQPTPNIVAPQLYGYSYGVTTVYGSNVLSAWRYSTGVGVAVALLDDGFDPTTTALYGNFSASLSRSFATDGSGDVGEPASGYHGTTTSGLIGSSGAGGMPVGIAPNVTIVGVKVTFGDAPFSTFVDALQYAAANSAVINNSWAFGDYGIGEPSDPFFASWYAALQSAVQDGRNGLGDVVVFAAGNDRADANDVGLQPINANPQVIAVAASDANGTVASYSNPGAGLLVAAVGDGVAVPMPGAQYYALANGTSYAAPTIAAISAMMLSVNATLGWRDVQEILADSAYAPAPSAAGFSFNGATDWNGGGRHFSDDLGFGVVDANVAVNLARAWTEQSTDADLVTRVAAQLTSVAIDSDSTISSALSVGADIRIQHVQVEVADVNLLVANTRLVLISPDGTQSVLLDQPGDVNSVDETGGLDLSGNMITSNAFWGEDAAGTWTLQVQDIGGAVVGTLQGWELVLWGDDVATVASPLVYTPEFASIGVTDTARTVVASRGTDAITIDLIALPGTTSIDLNGGDGMIDGVPVSVMPGLLDANAEGSIGNVTLIGRRGGGSELTGGDGATSITGFGRDAINVGLGQTSIDTGAGGSTITVNNSATVDTVVNITSGGGDTIWAGAATVTIDNVGTLGDTIFSEGANLTFIGGIGANRVYGPTGTMLVEGGQTSLAGAGVVSVPAALVAASGTMVAGSGNETLSGAGATGDFTLIGGPGNDVMIASAGRTNFVVGTGDAAIMVGGSADVVTVQNGYAGGLNTITGFRVGIDDLQLVGYASNEVAQAVSAQASDGQGGCLLSLSDRTRIDLAGIQHAAQAMFA